MAGDDKFSSRGRKIQVKIVHAVGRARRAVINVGEDMDTQPWPDHTVPYITVPAKLRE